MTEEPTQRILSERLWPDGRDVDDVDGLLRIFKCNEIGDLEDYVWGLLPEDHGDVTIHFDGGSVCIQTTGVLMWSLSFPFSAAEFDAYLFELDERMNLQTLLWELPSDDTWEDGESSVVPALAELFRTTREEFVASLGDDWRPLDLDWVGSNSSPSRFVQTGRSVVGMDNDNAYLFRPIWEPSRTDCELNGEYFEEVRWVDELWDGGGPSLEWFVSFVYSASRGAGRGTCPECGSRGVTHIFFGLPADPDEYPPWVRLAGCVVDGDPANRHCESCGHDWSAMDIAQPVTQVGTATAQGRPAGPKPRRRTVMTSPENSPIVP